MKNVIIIGAGIGGLMAGNLLAKKGHKVIIFESHSAPGGYTAGFWRKGFYFESGTLSFESSATIFKSMKDIEVYDKIDFVRQKTRFASEECDVIPESYQEYRDAMLSAYPDEKEGLSKYFAEVDKMYEAMGSSDEPMPSLYDGLAYVKAMASIMSNLKAMRLYKQYENVTINEFTEKFISKDSKLYRLLSGIGYPEMASFFLGGAFGGIVEDYWTVKSGMQSWADILAENFKELGGELKLKSYVDKIITKDGVAVGVSCNDTNYEADYVISACDYKKTLLKLLDDKSLIPEDMQKKIQEAAVSEGCFTVYLGLNMSNDKLKEYMKVPHVAYYKEDSHDNKFFQESSFMVYSPSLINPKLAPEGKSSLMLQTFVTHDWMKKWDWGNKEKYMELKNKAMEALIQMASTLIPDLSTYVEYQDAATPLTYERFTHNSDGATSAWSWNPKKRFYNQPMGVSIKTPVDNLYIGSCWATQIGGVPSAISAAYECVKKLK